MSAEAWNLTPTMGTCGCTRHPHSPTPLTTLPKGWLPLPMLLSSMGEWEDPAPPHRCLPCTASGSSAQSPRVPSIILKEAADLPLARASFRYRALGLLIPQSPTLPSSLFPVSVGEMAAVGERMGVGKGKEREEQRTNLISSSIQPPPLFSASGRKGPWRPS